jgi:ligand-binding sensor domain-containing protein
VVFFVSCEGQNPSSVGGSPKIKKNYFITEFPQESFFVQCGLEDKKGKMWFGTGGNGIYCYDGKSFVNFNHKSFINFSLKEDLNHNDIICCMEDKSGNIWFGTRRGVILYKPSSDKVEAKDFSLILIPANAISGNSRKRLPYKFQTGENLVWSIIQDKSGKIWVGTIKDVYVHNPSTDNDSEGPLFRRFLDNDSIINDQHLQLMCVNGMQQDRDGNIWFLSGWTEGEGLVRFDGKSVINFKPDGLNSFRSVIQRQNGDLLFLNSFHGVYSYDGKSFYNLSKKIGINNDTLVSMKEDQNGNLWFGHNSDNLKNGGDGGLWFYDGKSLKQFTTKDGLSHNHVFCMVTDRQKHIWFGTRNTGLCRYDGKFFIDFTDR